MTQSPTEKVISVLGAQFLQPIAHLLDRMIARPYQKPDDVSSNFYECGYAASIILLLAATVESMVARDRFLNPNSNGYEKEPSHPAL